MTKLPGKSEDDRQRFLDFYGERYRHLNEIIQRRFFGSRRQNPLLSDAYTRFEALNKKGKRYRGVLVYIGCLLAGNTSLSEADALAEAYEIFQTAVLIHDDIADRGDRRRGMTTIHRQYFREFCEKIPERTQQDAAELEHTAESAALCIGDIGFYLGEQRLAAAYGTKPYFGALLDYYHRALIRTLEGELLDIELPCLERYGLQEHTEENAAGQTNGEVKLPGTADAADGHRESVTSQSADLESLITDIHELKTSSYTVTGPLCAGMLLGNVPPDTFSRMEAICNMVGRAFQIKDDLDGIFAESASIGKDAASDIREFKTTLLYAYVKKKGGQPYSRLLKYYGKQNLTEEDIRAVQSIFRDTGAETDSRNKMAGLFAAARRELEGLTGVSAEGKALFAGFLSFLEQKENV